MKTFHITENDGDERHGYALTDDAGIVLRVDSNPKILASLAFNFYGAGIVRHTYDLVKAES